jgi:glycine cleavage system aminomethyltransferase T
MLFPNVRRSPYFARTEAAGAVAYMAYNHMYMPMGYGRDPSVGYRAVTEGVALWDVAAERQVEITGPDALALADLLTTRALSSLEAGQCRYALVCDEDGIVLCDPVVLHVAEGRIWLSHGNIDLLLWVKGVRHGLDLEVAVAEADVPPMQLQGPLARDVLAPLVGPDLDRLAYYRLMQTSIAGVPCVVSRTGWTGGPGYEIFPLGSAPAVAVWDALAATGEPYGLVIDGPNVPRALERGITDTALQHGQGANALELAERLVDLDAGPFVGRDALLAVRAAGIARRTVGLIVEAGTLPSPVGIWPILAAGRRVGGTRWVARSPALGTVIAIGLVESACAEPGTGLVLRHPDGDATCRVTRLPFVGEPAGLRT